MGSIIIIGLAATLFAAAFFTKRRFGVLVLGLYAGAAISGLWAAQAAHLVEQQGVVLTMPPLDAVVSVVLTLLPSLLLLFGGPKYKRLWLRITGSVLFALLAIVFAREPLNESFVLGAVGDRIFEVIGIYEPYIILVSALLAVVDTLLAKGRKPLDEKAHKK